MALSSIINRNDYTGNDNTSTYNYGFKIFSENDLKVIKRDTDDVETVLTLGSAGSGTYTVTGVGNANGGSIVLNGGNLPSNYHLTIKRKRALKQETDVRNQGAFYQEIHEDAFDHFIMIDQTQQDDIDRSFKLPDTIQVSAVSPVLPIPSANKFIRWNDVADALENKNIADLGATTIGDGLTLSVDKDLSVNDASATQKGKIEIATDAEAIAGTDTSRAITPKNLDAVLDDKNYQTPLVAGTDYQTPLVAGTDYQTPLVAGTDYLKPDGDGSQLTGIAVNHITTNVTAATTNLTAAQCTGLTTITNYGSSVVNECVLPAAAANLKINLLVTTGTAGSIGFKITPPLGAALTIGDTTLSNNISLTSYIKGSEWEAVSVQIGASTYGWTVKLKGVQPQVRAYGADQQTL